MASVSETPVLSPPVDEVAAADGAETPAAVDVARTRVDRRLDLALRVGAVLLVLAPIVAALLATRGHPWFPVSDDAVIELQTMDVPQHLPLVGVFSRYGFHHPGPAAFLVYALPVRAFGPPGLLVGAALINGASVAGTVLYLFRRGGRVLLVGGVVALLVIERAFAGELLDPWNSWVAVLPFAFAIVLAWSVWCRDRWALPVLAVVLSFLVQTHVGYALVAVWLFGSAVVLTGFGRRRWRVFVATAAAVLAAWALPLWGQLTQSPGNLWLIFHYFTSGTDATLGAGRALDLLAREVGVTAPWLGGDEPIAVFTAGVDGGNRLMLLPLVAVFVATMVLVWLAARRLDADRPARRAAMDAWRLQWVLVGVTVASVVSLDRISGEPYPYLIRWLWIVGVLLWLSSAWAAWAAWGAWMAGRRAPVQAPTGERAPRAWTQRVAATVVIVALVAMTIWAAVPATRSPVPEPQYAAAIAALADPVTDAARGRGNLLVTPEGSSWLEIESGLVAELERRGIPVFVADSGAFTFDEHRTVQGRRIDGRLVVAVNEAVIARQKAGTVPIAIYDPLSEPERAELDALTVRYTDEVGALQKGEPVADPLTRADAERADALHQKGHLVAVYADTEPPSLPPIPLTP